MLQRNINNSILRSLVSHRAKGLCFSTPNTNTYVDTVNSTNNTNKTNNKSVSQIHSTQVKEYYNKYTYEVVLTYSKKAMTLKERKRSLRKFIIKLFEKLYGSRNVEGMTFDFYAVLEFKDKFKNPTHPHWHLLLYLPGDRNHWDLEQQFVDEHLVWDYGAMWVCDEPLYDPYKYITDYLDKHDCSVHYYGQD